MRLIPRNTKVQTSFYKGVTVSDVILSLVGLGLVALAVASNLPYRLYIALGIVCLFIPLFIPVGEECIYKCVLYLARHIFSRKKYTAKGKDAANIQSIIPYERIDGNIIVNKDGSFTGVQSEKRHGQKDNRRSGRMSFVYRREIPDCAGFYVSNGKAYPQIQRYGNRHYAV